MGWCERDRCAILKEGCRKRCGTVGYRKCDHYATASEHIIFPDNSSNLLPVLDSMPLIPRKSKSFGMHQKDGVLYFTSKYPNYVVKSTRWDKLRGMLSKYARTESVIDANLICAYLSEILETYDSCEICGKVYRRPVVYPMCYKCKTTKILKMCKNYYFPWDTTINVSKLFDSSVDADIYPLTLTDLNGMLDKFNMMRGF